MSEDSHTGHEPHPTAAMDRQLKNLLYQPNEDAIFLSDFNEDEVVHTELIGKRRVYSEAAYNKLRDALLSLTNAVAREAQYDDVLFKHLGAEIINARAVLQEAEG